MTMTSTLEAEPIPRIHALADRSASTRSKGGRPSKFNKAIAEQAVALAKHGRSRREIVKAIGIGERTLDDWLADPRKADFAKRFLASASKHRPEPLILGPTRRERKRMAKTRERRRSRRRYLAFKAARADWWLARLGPLEFWRRRVVWMRRRNLTKRSCYAEATGQFAAALALAETLAHSQSHMTAR